MRRIEHYRTILHGNPQGLVETDKAGRIIFCNREFGRIFNCSTSSVKGKPLISITGRQNTPPEMLSHFSSIFTTNPPPSERIFIFASPDPPKPAIRLEWDYITNNDGAAEGFIFKFITSVQPIPLVDCFHEIEEQHRNLMEHSNDGVIILRGSTILHANRSAVKISGLNDTTQVIGRSILDFIHRDLYEIYRSRLEDMEYCDRMPPVEQWSIRRNGEAAMIEVTAAPVTYMGKPAVQVIIRDRTEWDAINDQLKQNHEFLRRITDNVRDAIFVVDISTFVYTYANRYFEELFGIPVEKIIGSRPGLKLTGENVREILAVLKEELESDHEREPERTRIHLIKEKHYTTGKTIWFEAATIFVRDDEGKPVSIMGIARDITARKTAEERIARLNRCFLGFGTDPDENIRMLIEVCGELLEGDCALYNRISDGYLVTSAAWNRPEGYNPVDPPDGHICYDVINGSIDGTLLVRDLQNSKYRDTDPNVRTYGLQTYIGQQVRCNNRAIGSLCVVYTRDVVPGAGDLELLGIIARAVGIEEDRTMILTSTRLNEARYRSLFDRMPIALFRASGGGNLIDVNPAMIDILGYNDRRELLMTNMQSFFHDSCDIGRLRKLLSQGVAVHDFETRLLRADGRILYASINISASGEPDKRLCYDGSFLDITERKRAEEGLRESEAKYRSIVETIEDGYYEIDATGNVVFCNEAFASMLGCRRNELIGINYRSFLKDVNLCRAGDLLEDILQPGNTAGYTEHKVIRRDGIRRIFDFSVSIMHDGEGRPSGFRGIARDITRRKRHEEGLLRADMLESLGLLAGGIAHDFNNLLTSILGNLSLVNTAEHEDDRRREYLEDIRKAALQAQGLTQQLHTFAKGGEPVRQNIIVTDLLRDTAQFTLRGSNVKCEFDYNSGIRKVLIDRSQMHQVFYNLILNAQQAMPGGGTITISVQNAEIASGNELLLPPGNYVRITVADRGEGISPELQGKIFNPYFTTKPKGSGLGLSIVYSIIKKHSGHIGVQSGPGAGTSFIIHLPVSGENMPADAGCGNTQGRISSTS